MTKEGRYEVVTLKNHHQGTGTVQEEVATKVEKSKDTKGSNTGTKTTSVWSSHMVVEMIPKKLI